jgi:hypothetical protein
MLRRLSKASSGGELWGKSAMALIGEMDGKPEMQQSMGIVHGWRSQEFWRSLA